MLQKCLVEKSHTYQKRKGERYESILRNINLSNQVYQRFGNIELKNYIYDFKRN